MNITHFQHALATAVLQIIIGLATGDWLTGGLIGFGFFFGREVAQAEYRWIEVNGGLRKLMPTLQGFDISRWTADAKIDAALPAVVAAAIYFGHQNGVAQYVAAATKFFSGLMFAS